MNDVTIYFVGGSSVVLENCKCANQIIEWLDNENNKITFKVDIPFTNKTKVFRKDLILFVDII